MEKTYEYQKVRMSAIRNETIKLQKTKIRTKQTLLSQLKKIKS